MLTTNIARLAKIFPICIDKHQFYMLN